MQIRPSYQSFKGAIIKVPNNLSEVQNKTVFTASFKSIDVGGNYWTTNNGANKIIYFPNGQKSTLQMQNIITDFRSAGINIAPENDPNMGESEFKKQYPPDK